MTVTEDRPAGPRTEIGNARRRKEDQRLITGRTRWTDNIQLTGMLHIAMVRSPFAHATITNIDTTEAKAAPNVVAVLTGEDVKDEQGSLPNAWPITPDQVTPTTRPIAVDRVAFAGEIVAVVVARTRGRGARRRRARRRRLRGAARRPRPQGGRRGQGPRAPRPRHQQVRVLAVRLRRGAGTGGDVEEAIADGPHRRHRHRARVPPAAADPGVHGAALRRRRPDRRADDHVVGDPDPAHPALPARRRASACPSPRSGSSRPDVGGGFGGKLQVTPEEFITFMAARRLGKPVKYTETRSESLMAAHHGRDQWQKLTAGGHQGRHGHRPQGRPARRPRRLRRARRRRRPGARRVHVQLDLQVPGLPVQLPDGADQQDLDRRLPRRRPARGHLRHRADHGRARRRARRRPARGPREELDQARRVPVHHGLPAWSTTPATTRRRPRKAKEIFGYDELRAEQKRRRESNDPVQLGIGVSTFTEMCGLAPSRVLGSLDYGAGGWESASVRMLPTGKVEVVTGSSAHGQGHETAWSQIVADRLGVAFEDVEVLHGDTQVAHQGHGHLRLALAGRRRRGARPGRRQGDREGQADRGPPARGVRRRHRVQGGHASASRAPTRGWRSAEVALATFAAHNLPDGIEPSHRRGRDVRPGELLLPARHPPVRGRDRHRDRRR